MEEGLGGRCGEREEAEGVACEYVGGRGKVWPPWSAKVW